MSEIDYMRDVKGRAKLLKSINGMIAPLKAEMVAGASIRSYGLAAMVSSSQNLPLVVLNDEGDLHAKAEVWGKKIVLIIDTAKDSSADASLTNQIIASGGKVVSAIAREKLDAKGKGELTKLGVKVTQIS